MESPNTGLAQLDARRVALGMTIEVLARRSGVSPSTVERILSGHYGAASFHAIERIAAAVGGAVRLEAVVDVSAMRLAQAELQADRILAAGAQPKAGKRGEVVAAGDEAEILVDSEAAKLLRAAERERLVHRLLGGSNRKLWAD
jgi:transcriptional regulator with XRE-family HTH domain